jgi:hypothetical protein
MALLNVASFQTIDQDHFINTGEHLTPNPGDLCPQPAEYYIRRTQDRQQRARAYEVISEKLTTDALTPIKSGTLTGVHYTHAAWGSIYDPERCIKLYDAQKEVMTIWCDGRERKPLSIPTSPAPPFVMRPPWQHDDISLDDATGIAEATRDRVRPNFRHLLSEMPMEALWAEMEEWQEEVKRATEHVAAIEAEFFKRRHAPQN